MLIEDIKKSIVAAGFKHGEKMPSVRKMSERLKLSVATVHKVYKELAREGSIKLIQGKGCFWGDAPAVDVAHAEDVYDTIEKSFVEDLENGYLNAFEVLPATKELSIRYNVSPYIIKVFLNRKVSQGVLKHVGHKFFFNEERPVENLNYILFVHRSDEHGRLLIESERESSVFRTLALIAAEQRIAIRFIGYYEKTGTLHSADGKVYIPREDRYCLGVFLSTWLVKDSSKLFSCFALFKSPISVWWEYDPETVPASIRNKRKWAFYNVAFGKEAGSIVGKYLLSKGIKSACYVSPFHGSFWSRARLHGLQESGVEVNSLVDDSFHSPFELVDKATRLGKNSQKYLDEILEKMLGPMSDGKSVESFVCSNDWVASTLIDYFKRQKLPKPFVVGFDDTIDSYRYVFASFAFNVGTMVKEALYHIVAPTIYAEQRRQMQTPLGRVVEKI